MVFGPTSDPRKVEGVKFKLHPLIHTIAPETSAQDVEKKESEPKTPHFLSSNQDIVANPQEQKCGLKYVIYTPREMVGEFDKSD